MSARPITTEQFGEAFWDIFDEVTEGMTESEKVEALNDFAAVMWLGNNYGPTMRETCSS